MFSEHGHMKSEIDIIQMNFQCCGNENYQDWYNIPWHQTQGYVLKYKLKLLWVTN